MDSTPLNVVLALSAGVALAAATGVRAFLPLFSLGLAARRGWAAIRPAEQWLAGDMALIALGTATVLELLADCLSGALGYSYPPYNETELPSSDTAAHSSPD